MIKEHPVQIPLTEDLMLSRYFQREKYISLMETSTLFFCRADRFADPFEGSLPKKDADFRINFYTENYVAKGQEIDLDTMMKNIEGLGIWHRNYKRGTIVNCWHINNTESDAMWQLYLKDNLGIAIVTSTERIKAAVTNCEESIGITKIRYINYENDGFYHQHEYPVPFQNFFTPLFHKRKEFSHENELRLYQYSEDAASKDDYWDNQPNKVGKLVKIDLNILIEKIIFHPTSDDTIKQDLINISKANGYNFKFEDSKLQSEPRY